MTVNYDEIIDQIEAVRSRNNVNWMDVLRLAFKHDPIAAKGIMRKINEADGEIGELLNKLGEDEPMSRQDERMQQEL